MPSINNILSFVLLLSATTFAAPAIENLSPIHNVGGRCEILGVLLDNPRDTLRQLRETGCGGRPDFSSFEGRLIQCIQAGRQLSNGPIPFPGGPGSSPLMSPDLPILHTSTHLDGDSRVDLGGPSKVPTSSPHLNLKVEPEVGNGGGDGGVSRGPGILSHPTSPNIGAFPNSPIKNHDLNADLGVGVAAQRIQ